MIIQDRPEGYTAENKIRQRLTVVKPKKIVFYTVFVLAFLLSGIITMLDIVPYRMNLISLLVIPLLFIYGIRVDRILIVFVLLTIVVIISAVINQVSITQLALFLRSVLFAYLMVSLVRLTVTSDNITKIIRICVFIGMIQLPIVLLQFMTYDLLPGRITTGMNLSRVDYSFGTFHLKGDATMTFFVTLLVIFLLFDNKRNYIIQHKWLVVFWLTLTVLISNAELMKLAIVVVWTVYAIRFFSLRTLLIGATIILLLATILFFSGVLDEIIEDFFHTLESNLSTTEAKTERFLSGGYGRGAAIAYYLNNDIEWIGDGPSRYYDVITRERIRGNNGHIFTYYSEIGLIGLFLSYLAFFLIAFPIRSRHIRIRWVGILMFIVIVLLSFTTEILPTVSIVLIYSIVAMTYLIPEKEAGVQQVADLK
jgi:hypothetical protein